MYYEIKWQGLLGDYNGYQQVTHYTTKPVGGDLVELSFVTAPDSNGQRISHCTKAYKTTIYVDGFPLIS